MSDVEIRITEAALKLFYSAGIKKTTMEDVACQSGITRVTVYRHYKTKKLLVSGVFSSFLSVLERVWTEIKDKGSSDPEQSLDHIFKGLSALPSGDFVKMLQELELVYPDIYREFQGSRCRVMGELFHLLFESASEKNILREGLNRQVIQLFFSETVLKMIENPSLSGLSAHELFTSVKNIFLHGILKG